MRPLSGTTRIAALVAIGCAACSAESPPPETPAEAYEPEQPNRIVRLLAEGQPVFGVFSGDKTAEQGALMAQNQLADFILYSMESGPFDVAGMQAYLQGMVDAAGTPVLDEIPVVLRVPPIDEGGEEIRAKVREALDAGIRSIVYPHVEHPEQAKLSLDVMGDGVWPSDPGGELADILIIEDQTGVANAREIMATPGLTVVFAGPGDLRRAYEGDMEAVESAIQTVLSACKEFDVPCGITAGVDDIGHRLEEGWRMIIVTAPEALEVGLRASGRLK